MKQEFLNRRQDKIFAASLLALSIAACDDPSKVGRNVAKDDVSDAISRDYDQDYSARVICIKHGIGCHDGTAIPKDT